MSKKYAILMPGHKYLSMPIAECLHFILKNSASVETIQEINSFNLAWPCHLFQKKLF